MANRDKIQLRYEEQIYDVEYKGNTFKLQIIQDIQYGDCEAVVMKYNKHGELVVPTQRQREAVITIYNQEG